MDRRTFLTTLLATSAAGPALASIGVTYNRGLVEKELAAGNTVFVDFYAKWCSTCRVQGNKINALMDANPDYEKHITFVSVDWDSHGNSKLANDLNIPRRSTLVALKGDKELGRIVAGTSTEEIQALMDVALAAAKSS